MAIVKTKPAEANVPKVGAVDPYATHVILDNYATHKHPKVQAWLAARPRWHLHFIPTYSSWLNLVERFFALISDKSIGAARSTWCAAWSPRLITS